MPPKAKAREPIVNAATAKGQEPWMLSEQNIASSRDSQRKGALKALERPYSEFCSEAGRKRVVSALTEYWYHRSGQVTSFPKNWGESARPYIIKVWATADDNRIERLTREAYSNGYINLADFKSCTREAMAETLRGEHVRGKPCASTAVLR